MKPKRETIDIDEKPTYRVTLHLKGGWSYEVHVGPKMLAILQGRDGNEPIQKHGGILNFWGPNGSCTSIIPDHIVAFAVDPLPEKEDG